MGKRRIADKQRKKNLQLHWSLHKHLKDPTLSYLRISKHNISISNNSILHKTPNQRNFLSRRQAILLVLYQFDCATSRGGGRIDVGRLRLHLPDVSVTHMFIERTLTSCPLHVIGPIACILHSRSRTNRSSTVAVGISFFTTEFVASTHRAEIAHGEEIVGTRLSEGRRCKA